MRYASMDALHVQATHSNGSLFYASSAVSFFSELSAGSDVSF